MATLSEKIKIALDESRMLVLGTQVLISLQFELAFQGAFSEAPELCKKMVAVGLGFLLLTFMLLIWGAAFQRITERGQDTPAAHAFLTKAISLALIPLSFAFGVDAFIAFTLLGGTVLGSVFASIVIIICFLGWYLLGMIGRRSRLPEVRMTSANDKAESDKDAGEELHGEVAEVLTECRVVLPGAQAMLGFQFITMFEHSFSQLPKPIQFAHLACLSMIAFTVILLMIPPAFHRIAEAGQDSRRLVRLSSIVVVSAMVPLCVGMSGDFFVVVFKITHSLPLAAACGAVSLIGFITLWFGYTSYSRRKHSHRARPQVHGVLAG